MEEPTRVTIVGADTPRLQYACKLVFERLLGWQYQILAIQHANTITGNQLWYVDENPITAGAWLIPHGLLSDTGITSVKNLEALELDPLASVFWLATHYAAYDVRHPLDVHGRPLPAALPSYPDPYKPTCHALAWALGEKILGYRPPTRLTTLYHTFDIDNAYAYHAKGIIRWIGSFGKELFAGGLKAVFRRMKHVFGRISDPYDNHQLIVDALLGKGLHVFFLMAAKGRYDRAISHKHPDFARLVRMYRDAGATVGLHPSYAGGQSAHTFTVERDLLKGMLGKSITSTRYHYLRMLTPQTQRLLVDQGIKDDYSPGPIEPGFWQGISVSIPWYDVEKDIETPLEVHPAAWMDVHSAQNPASGLQNLALIQANLSAYGGRLILIWHNDYFASFATVREFSSVFHAADSY
jgi:hypothetical protein